MWYWDMMITDSYRKNPPHFGAPVGRSITASKGAVLYTIGSGLSPCCQRRPQQPSQQPDLYHDRGMGSAVLLRQIKAAGWTFYLESPDPGTRDIRQRKITVSYT